MTIGHRHTVAGDNARIGIKAEQAPRTASGEHYRFGTQQNQLTGGNFQGNHTNHSAFVDGQVEHKVLIEALNLGVFEGSLKQGVEHMEAGLIGGEPGAGGFHAPKAAYLYLTVILAAPGAAPALHLHQLLIGVVDKVVDDALLNQPVTAGYRVVKVRLVGIFWAGNRSRPAFSSHGMGAHGIHLGEHRNTLRRFVFLSVLSSRDSSTQACTSPTHNHDIEISLLHDNPFPLLGSKVAGATLFDAYHWMETTIPFVSEVFIAHWSKELLTHIK